MSSSLGTLLSLFLKLTKAQVVSPQKWSRLATTATSFTAGFEYNTDSTSFDLQIPIWVHHSHISRVKQAIIFHAFQSALRFFEITKPISLFSPFPDAGLTTSTSTNPMVLTPFLALSRALSEAGKLFRCIFQAHEPKSVPVFVKPYP
ncbi:hypothetical protein M0R45_011406 [Rubus argutus]|uniref:Uncharacterized protein n=1 Tax=Rubus argutus TaxID=59490 RepID=A0AAW1Y9T3_RUBAR